MQPSTHTKLPLLLLIVLGLMTAFGPMIIDMYLPALPEAQHQFRSSTSEIQLTLSFAMIGLALDNSYLAHYLMHLVVKEWVLSYYVYFS